MWDVYVHFLEIKAAVRTLGQTGRPPGGFLVTFGHPNVTRPAGRNSPAAAVKNHPMQRKRKPPKFLRQFPDFIPKM